MTLGDRIGVMSGGQLLQLGTPQEIYRRPANVFVAGFIGSPPMNLLKASATGGRVDAGDLVLEVSGPHGGELVVGVRPEALRLVTDGAEGHAMQVRVEVVELLGHETIVYGSIRGQRVATASSAAGIPSLSSERAIVVARLDARRQPAVGETITLGMSLEDVHFFDAGSGEAVARPEPLASRHLAGS
jgi:multiple sugar transport system ATP-binding protein